MTSSMAAAQARANVIFDFDLTLFPEESTVSLIKALIHGDENLTRFLDEYKDTQKSLKKKISSAKNYISIISKIKKTSLKNFADSSRTAINPIFSDLIVDLKTAGIKPHVISSGYTEIISPFINDLGIPNEDIAANRLLWAGNQALCIMPSVLNGAKGKVEVVRRWKASGKIKGPVIMVGDGQADRNVYLHGLADAFIQANYYKKSGTHGLRGNFSISESPESLKQQLSELLEKIGNNS